MHQLAYYLRKLGMEAYIVYYTYSGFPFAQTIERYRQYEVKVVAYDEIEDESLLLTMRLGASMVSRKLKNAFGG